MDTEKLTVWTLFHGDQLKKQECPRNADGDVVLFEIDGFERSVLYTPSLPCLTADIPSVVALYNHLLLFDGLIPFGGASDKIRLCRLYGADDDILDDGLIVTLVTPVASAKTGISWDIDLNHETFSQTWGEKYVHQKSLRQMIAIPKKETRSLLLTFKDRSLAPWWRVVKGSAKGLIVETANSY